MTESSAVALSTAPAASSDNAPKALSSFQKFAYAMGGGGWVIVDRLLLTYATVFYLPPGGAEDARIPDWSLFGVVTLWGVITLMGRVVDSITDPLMASLTDRSKHPFGRRRIWMAIGILPLCLFTALLFRPLDAGPTVNNAIYAGVIMTMWYVSYTVYNVPYTAFLADLGRTSEMRLQLSIWQAIAQIAGAAIVMIGGNAILGQFVDAGYKRTLADGTTSANADAYFFVAIIFAVIAALWMASPVAFINERKHVREAVPSKESPFRDLLSTLSSSNLRWFLLGTVAYWFSFNTVAQCVNYYVIVLMGKSESFAALVMAAVFGVIGLTFPVVQPLARRFGRRRIMIVGALSQAVLMMLVAFIKEPTIGTVLMAMSGIPTCFVMCVPNSILADLAEQDARESGINREGMVFAAQAFFLKVNLGVSTAVIAALLTLGRTADNPLGIRLTGPAASVVLLISAFAFFKLKEPRDTSD